MNPVRAFERAFADYVGAKHAIALCNGTATLHTALVAMGVRDRKLTVPPLTMASTTIAVLHAGATPLFTDVDPDTWLLDPMQEVPEDDDWMGCVPVSLYGLHAPTYVGFTVDDAAQTLRPHGGADFTSYSFQASKILPLGEGGMLVTDNEELARKAREFSSLGYPMDADQPRIDKAALKDPYHPRHDWLGFNYRVSYLVADRGLNHIHGTAPFVTCGPKGVEDFKKDRHEAAALYREATQGTSWITPQHVPDGWSHDYWCYAVALESADLWHPFVDAIERHGGERPYAAWRLTYHEPAFRHLAEDGTCPVAEGLQPRLVQFQTNDIESAKRNAEAVHSAIREVEGVPA